MYKVVKAWIATQTPHETAAHAVTILLLTLLASLVNLVGLTILVFGK